MAKNDEPIEEYQEEPIKEPSLIPEPEFEPQGKRLGTGEPIYLYVKTSATSYDNVGEFPSRIEASRYAEENWSGYRYKTLSASEAIAEQEKFQRRQEKIQKTGEMVSSGAKKAGRGLLRVAKNLGRNAESEARYHGMIHDAPPRQQGQNINVNVNTAPQQRQDGYEELRKFGRGINERFNPAAENFNPPESPQRKQYMIQKPESRFSFSPPASPIRPSNKVLNPPVQSKKQYGVRQRHGGFMFNTPFHPPMARLYPNQNRPSNVVKPRPVKRKKKRRKR